MSTTASDAQSNPILSLGLAAVGFLGVVSALMGPPAAEQAEPAATAPTAQATEPQQAVVSLPVEAAAIAAGQAASVGSETMQAAPAAEATAPVPAPAPAASDSAMPAAGSEPELAAANAPAERAAAASEPQSSRAARSPYPQPYAAPWNNWPSQAYPPVQQPYYPPQPYGYPQWAMPPGN